jgi:L-threonylcarbamoyladenylate synthase
MTHTMERAAKADRQATLRQPADETAVAAAARCLAEGRLVAFPTETVYGLGADATNAIAVARLYAAKGRPRFNPLIAHVADLAAAEAIAILDPDSRKLAQAFWPGPVTLVLRKAPGCPVSDLATAGLDTLAVRMPAHPVALALLRALGRPIVAPSANLSGHVSPTSADHVESDLAGRIAMILDAGPVPVGIESTIESCLDTPRLLRPGGLPRATIERVLGQPLARPGAAAAASPTAPGMLASHYAPRATLRMNADTVAPGEALLAFGAGHIAGEAAAELNLSERGDLAEAAANLFGHLRALDRAGVASIAVMPVPSTGLGEAINDRLARAAAPRPSTRETPA